MRPSAGSRLLARQLLGGSARTMPLFDRLSTLESERRVGDATEVCIEGFPRSGNSWAVVCFERWNPGVKTANHAHVPGQVLEAVGRGLPTALVVRNPLDAVASYLVYAGGGISVGQALWSYEWFHSRLRTVAAQIAICEFSELIATPRLLVERLNARAGTAFAAEDVDEDFRAKTLSDLSDRAVALGADPATQQSAPSAERAALSERARSEVGRHRRLAQAQRTYEELLAAA